MHSSRHSSLLTALIVLQIAACDSGPPREHTTASASPRGELQKKHRLRETIAKASRAVDTFLGGVHVTDPKPLQPAIPGALSPFVQILDPRACVDEGCSPDQDGRIHVHARAFHGLPLDGSHAKCDDFWPAFNDELIAPLNTDHGCSGTVAEFDGSPVIFTAAHCLDASIYNNDDFEGWLIIFGRHRGAAWVQESSEGDELLIDAARTSRTSKIRECEDVEDERKMDWAVLELKDGLDLSPVPLREGPLVLGERLHTISHPLGLPLAKTTPEALPHASTYFRIRASLGTGSSGGGVFDEDGQLVGVIEGVSYLGEMSGDCSRLTRRDYVTELPAFTPMQRIAPALRDPSVYSVNCPAPRKAEKQPNPQ